MYHVALFSQLVLVGQAVHVGHVVFQVEQMALFLAVNHLLVAQGCLGFGVPVHHAQAAVDEAFVVEVNKHLDDTLRAFLVHGEGRAVPVAAGTQAAKLLQNDASVFVGPVPGMLKKLLAGEVALLDALFGQFFHHLGLGGNRGVVGAGHPACVFALHTGTAHQDVLNGVVKHVSHVEHTRHVGRRNNDCVGFPSVGFTCEELVVKPVLIPFRLHNLRVVFTC